MDGEISELRTQIETTMTPETVILIADKQLQLDRKDAKWCERKGVGALRAKIGPANVEPISSVIPSVRA